MKLPVADAATVRRYAARLLRVHGSELSRLAVLHTLGATAGLVGPFLLGRVVDAITRGTTGGYIDRMVAFGLVMVVTQAGLVRTAQRASIVFGEKVFASRRSPPCRCPPSSAPAPATSSRARRTTSTGCSTRCASGCRA